MKINNNKNNNKNNNNNNSNNKDNSEFSQQREVEKLKNIFIIFKYREFFK